MKPTIKQHRILVFDDPETTDLRNVVFSRAVEEDWKRIIRERDGAIIALIGANCRYYRAPSDSMLDGDEGFIVPSLICPSCKVYERLDIPQFFLRFPRALPVELKGIAV